jgi:hypothetical protein
MQLGSCILMRAALMYSAGRVQGVFFRNYTMAGVAHMRLLYYH